MRQEPPKAGPIPAKVAKNDLHALVAFPVADPKMETLLSFIRSVLIFMVSFFLQYVLTGQSDFTQMSTYAALIPLVIYWVIDAVLRYLRYSNSPYTPIAEALLEADRAIVSQKRGGRIVDLPPDVVPHDSGFQGQPTHPLPRVQATSPSEEKQEDAPLVHEELEPPTRE